MYYQDDVIIGSKQNFIKLAKQKLKASTKEINEFLKNQEINQVNKKPTKHTNLKLLHRRELIKSILCISRWVKVLKIYY